MEKITKVFSSLKEMETLCKAMMIMVCIYSLVHLLCTFKGPKIVFIIQRLHNKRTHMRSRNVNYTF